MAYKQSLYWRKTGMGYVGLDILPYQIAMGFTIRWFEKRLHLRFYIGPFRLWLGGA